MFDPEPMAALDGVKAKSGQGGVPLPRPPSTKPSTKANRRYPLLLWRLTMRLCPGPPHSFTERRVKKPKRGPNCGAKTPMPVPLRSS
jgi:hypothetical protein